MDDIKETLEKLREELTNAGKRLAELANKAEAELSPGIQELLDQAVDKLRKK